MDLNLPDGQKHNIQMNANVALYLQDVQVGEYLLTNSPYNLYKVILCRCRVFSLLCLVAFHNLVNLKSVHQKMFNQLKFFKEHETHHIKIKLKYGLICYLLISNFFSSLLCLFYPLSICCQPVPLLLFIHLSQSTLGHKSFPNLLT